MNPRTQAKLETRIKETAAQVILRDLADPRLGFVTVTGVRLSPELDIARISVSILGEEGVRSRSLHALDDARGFIQEALGRVLTTRRTPRVVFVEDDSIRNAARISEVIQTARAEDEAAARQRGEEPERLEPRDARPSQ
jgi:ribosome-binding factor A